MKKTLIAAVVMAATGSASAIELYNQDDVTVFFGGSIEVFYANGFDDADFTQQLGDADFSFDTRYQVNSELAIGGFWEYDGLADAALGDAYIGLYSNNYGSVVFGKTATILDDMGVGSDYQFGINSAFDAFDFDGTEVVRYNLDTGSIYGGIGLMQNHDGSKDGSVIDGKIGFRTNGFDLVAFAGQQNPTVGDDKSNVYAFEGRYTLNDISLELGYYSVGKDNSDEGGNTIAAAADYNLDAWTFATGFANVNPEDSATSSFTEGFVNAGYAIAPFTTVYAEIGFTNADVADSVAYAVGISAEF